MRPLQVAAAREELKRVEAFVLVKSELEGELAQTKKMLDSGESYTAVQPLQALQPLQSYSHYSPTVPTACSPYSLYSL